MDLPANISFTETPVVNGIRFVTVHDHETREINTCAAVPEASTEMLQAILVDWVRSMRRDLAEAA